MADISALEQLAHRPVAVEEDDGFGMTCSEGSIRVVSGSGFRYVVPFPYRLHKMLSDVEARGDASIVSFMPDGLHFKVHNPQRFVDEIITKAFKQKSLKSFQRQLHLYGFQRAQEGPNKGGYYHENFVKNDRDLCLTISRIKAPKRRMGPQNNNKLSGKKAQAKGQQVTVSPTENVVMLSRGLSNSCTHGTPPLHLGASSGIAFNDRLLSVPSENVDQTQGDEADTYQWLINAGVPFSAFDPVSFSDQMLSTTANASELLDCADEITSLFATTPASSPRRAARLVPPSVAMDTPVPLLACVPNGLVNSATPRDTTSSGTEGVPLPVSPSINPSDDQMPLVDLLLEDGSLPNIGNDNWALW